jgi:hypothetical protein
MKRHSPHNRVVFRRLGWLAALATIALVEACAAAPPAPTSTSVRPSTATATGSTTPAPTAASLPTSTAVPPPTTALSTPSPDVEPTSTANNGPTTHGILPPELSATFAARISLSQVAEPDQAGDWFLTLSPTGGYQLGRVASGVIENTGTLAVDGDHLTFSDELGIGACPGEGSYTWSVEGDALTFAKVSDGCAVRVAQNTSTEYSRCPDGADSCRDVLD